MECHQCNSGKKNIPNYNENFIFVFDLSQIIRQGMFIVSLPFAVLRGGYWAIAAMIGIAHICCYTGKNRIKFQYKFLNGKT